MLGASCQPLIALIVAIFEMAHKTFVSEFSLGVCLGFSVIPLLSAKEHLEKGIFSRLATRSGVGAGDRGCHIPFVEFHLHTLEIPN